MAKGDAYPWTRRATESSPAYEAFRTYMDVRSVRGTADQLSKSDTLIGRWCTEHDWVSRIQAYDSFLMQSKTDGAVEWITSARTETQALADKLRALLSERLDDCITKKQDPTVRWSQAASVLLKMQDAAVTPVSDEKMAAELDRVAKLLEKVTGEAVVT